MGRKSLEWRRRDDAHEWTRHRVALYCNVPFKTTDVIELKNYVSDVVECDEVVDDLFKLHFHLQQYRRGWRGKSRLQVKKKNLQQVRRNLNSSRNHPVVFERSEHVLTWGDNIVTLQLALWPLDLSCNMQGAAKCRRLSNVKCCASVCVCSVCREPHSRPTAELNGKMINKDSFRESEFSLPVCRSHRWVDQLNGKVTVKLFSHW